MPSHVARTTFVARSFVNAAGAPPLRLIRSRPGTEIQAPRGKEKRQEGHSCLLWKTLREEGAAKVLKRVWENVPMNAPPKQTLPLR